MHDPKHRVMKIFLEHERSQAQNLQQLAVGSLSAGHSIQATQAGTVYQISRVGDRDASPEPLNRHARSLAVRPGMALLIVMAAAAIDGPGIGVVAEKRKVQRT